MGRSQFRRRRDHRAFPPPARAAARCPSPVASAASCVCVSPFLGSWRKMPIRQHRPDHSSNIQQSKNRGDRRVRRCRWSSPLARRTCVVVGTTLPAVLKLAACRDCTRGAPIVLSGRGTVGVPRRYMSHGKIQRRAGCAVLRRPHRTLRRRDRRRGMRSKGSSVGCGRVPRRSAVERGRESGTSRCCCCCQGAWSCQRRCRECLHSPFMNP